MILLDVDRFKRVNDTYGHAAGDELLAVTAARLRAWAHRVGGGACGRLGGDEFTAITRRAVTDAETADLAALLARPDRCPAPASPSPCTASVGAAACARARAARRSRRGGRRHVPGQARRRRLPRRRARGPGPAAGSGSPCPRPPPRPPGFRGCQARQRAARSAHRARPARLRRAPGAASPGCRFVYLAGSPRVPATVVLAWPHTRPSLSSPLRGCGSQVGLAPRKRGELLALLRPCFARTGPWLQAGKYAAAVMSELPQRHGWSIARHAGDKRRVRPSGCSIMPARPAAGSAAVPGVRGPGRERDNTPHLSHVREGTGRALIGARQRISREHLDDPVRSLVTGLPDREFRTKGQLAIDISKDAADDGIRPGFHCGDEVHGNCTELRGRFEAEGQASALRVPSNFDDHARGRFPETDLRRRGQAAGEAQPAAGGPLRRERLQGRAMVRLGVAGHRLQRRHLLIRRHLKTGELAFHYCYVPDGQSLARPG